MSFKPDIVDHKTVVCGQSVALLERLLVEVKAGQISGVMVFAEYVDGMIMHSFTDSESYEKRLANIEMLKFQWMCEMSGLIDDDD